ncbi:hypothetical protein G6F54_013803 [Rhizopus delemar]|nr:hypothetical protein G6F54_013803 [Rhizopus delemar]
MPYSGSSLPATVASSNGCRIRRLVSSTSYSTSALASTWPPEPMYSVAELSNLYGARPWMPSAAQVRESAGRKSWRTPTSTSHHGDTLRPYSASSADDSVRPRLRSPSVRSHRRLMLPPIQPVASQAWPLLLLPSQ